MFFNNKRNEKRSQIGAGSGVVYALVRKIPQGKKAPQLISVISRIWKCDCSFGRSATDCRPLKINRSNLNRILIHTLERRRLYFFSNGFFSGKRNDVDHIFWTLGDITMSVTRCRTRKSLISHLQRYTSSPLHVLTVVKTNEFSRAF